MRILIGTSDASLDKLILLTLERFKYEIIRVDNGFDVFQKIISSEFDLLILDFHLLRMDLAEILSRLAVLQSFQSPPILCLTASEIQRQAIEAVHFPKAEIISKPFPVREFIQKVRQRLHEVTRIVCIGGGTGLFTLLSGLKSLSGVRLTSVVSMSDDGGSTGRLRHMFGVLPPGDIRRSLVALSTAPDLVNELMQYRFERGGELRGHNLGNLLLTALSEMRGGMSAAVRALGEILDIQGEVIPVTESLNTLHAELENGEILKGESAIDVFESTDPSLRIRRLWQEPDAVAHPGAIEALLNAKYILMGPGDLFTSVVSNLIVRGMAESIAASRARKIYICNIMTEPGETNNFQVSDHVREILKYLGRDCLDVILSSSTTFSAAALETYAQKKQFPVIQKDPSELRALTHAQIFSEDIASEDELVRHDSLKVAAAVRKIIEQDPKGE